MHVFLEDQRHNTKRVYAIMDDQNNQSSARTEFFDMLDIQGSAKPYTLKTCAGVAERSDRRACGYVVESIDGNMSLLLPEKLYCEMFATVSMPVTVLLTCLTVQ